MSYIAYHASVFFLVAMAIGLPARGWSLILRDIVPAGLRPLSAIGAAISTWIVAIFILCALRVLHTWTVVLVLWLFLYFVLVQMRGNRWSWRDLGPMAGLGTLAALVWFGPGAPRVLVACGLMIPLTWTLIASTVNVFECLQRRRSDWQAGRLVLIVPLAGVLLALFCTALTPTVAWDADTYHLTVPRLYLEAGGFRRIPFNVYSNWPLNTELLYGAVLLFADHVTATLVDFGFALAVTIAVVSAGALGAGTSARWAGWIAAALFWANGTMQEMAGVAYVDLAYVFFFLSAFLFTWQAMEDVEHRRGLLRLAGVCGGILAGIKLNGMVGVLAISTVFLARLVSKGADRPSVRLWLVDFWLPVVLLASVWPIKTWILTGNPFYPFFWRYFGAPEWSEALTAKLTQWQLSLGMGRTATDYMLLPYRVLFTGEGNYKHFAGSLTPAWVVLLPVALIGGWRSRFARTCLGVAGLAFVFWALSSQQLRFLMPSIALLAIATGIAVTEIARRSTAPDSVLAVMGLAVSGVLVWSAMGTFQRARQLAAAYVTNETLLAGPRLPPLDTYINEKLPKDARLLLINTNRGFFIHREYIADSFFEASQISDWLQDATSVEAVHQRLRAEGVTHILFGGKDWGYPPALMAMLRERRGVMLLSEDPRLGQTLLAVCDTLSCAQAAR